MKPKALENGTPVGIEQKIALKFSGILGEWLTPEQKIEVIKRNNQETDPRVCHSHDFVDPNEAMIEAFKHTTGRGFDHHSDKDIGIWGRAWGNAVENKFFHKGYNYGGKWGVASHIFLKSVHDEKGQRIHVETLNEASQVFQTWTAAGNLGSRDIDENTGAIWANHDTRKPIAYVSYNGRIWWPKEIEAGRWGPNNDAPPIHGD